MADVYDDLLAAERLVVALMTDPEGTGCVREMLEVRYLELRAEFGRLH